MYKIIDSYSKTEGKGLPLGSQASQWFALYYLDSLDRLIKERLQIKFYTRYMDDFILLHNDKNYLKYCRNEIEMYCKNMLALELNEKTQIFPVKNGINYLGWHIYLSQTGKVVKKITLIGKRRLRRRMKGLQRQYREYKINFKDASCSILSSIEHLSHGNTWRLRFKYIAQTVFTRNKT